MALFYQQNINDSTRLAIWKIEEQESFFQLPVPLNKKITNEHKRLQHLAGRYLLPALFPDFPNEEIEIADTRKPFLPNEQYHFSISHCADYAAAIVSSNQRVGIDVELITPKVERIKHKFLHPEELRFVNTQLKSNHEVLLTIMWCAKEAMFKWYGLGEVDFSEMMRLFPFQLEVEGEINGAFIKNTFQENLQLKYKVFGDLVLLRINSDIIV